MISILSLIFGTKFKRTSKLIFSISFFFLILETFFFIIEISNQTSINHFYEYSSDFRKNDHRLGYSIRENSEVNASLYIKNDNKIIYCYEDKTYTSDSKGRRVSIKDEYNASKHAIFFGGSFLFGNGLSNDQTLPSSFQFISNHKFKAYNYGQSGHCASHMLIKLKNPDLFDDIKERNGCAIYVFIKGHLKRSSGYYTYIKYYPWYPIFGFDNDQLTGPHYWLFGDHKYKIHLKLRQLAEKYSHTGSYLTKNIFDTCLNTQQQIDSNIQIITNSKKNYNQIFPNNPLIVVNWPRSGIFGDLKSYFKNQLQENDIHFFTPQPLSNIEKSKVHEYDDHPSRFEVQWVAKQLHEFIDGLPHSK